MTTYVFDLDGTICTQEITEKYHLATPIDKTIKKVQALYNSGNEIIIFTARGMNTYSGDINAIEKHMRPMTERWLRENKVPYHRLLLGKPAADVYVDDKAINVVDFLKED